MTKFILLIFKLFLAGLNHDQVPRDPASADINNDRQSKLMTLLQLGVHHAGEHEYTSTERTYLQGWRHCLLALEGNIPLPKSEKTKFPELLSK